MLPLLGVASILIEQGFKMPVALLDTVNELLDCLKSGGWDVSIPKQARDSFRKEIDQSVDRIKEILEKDYPNPAQQLDDYVGEYRRFLYIYMYVQSLYNSVKSLCKNYEISTKKLLGESYEKMQ